MNKSKFARQNTSEKVFDIWNYVFFGLLFIVTFYPFWYIFIYSLSDPSKASSGVFMLPKGFTLQNYIVILSNDKVLPAAIVSVVRTVFGMVLTVVCSSLFAYTLTKNHLPFKKLIYRGMIFTMYVSAGLIPWYLTMLMLGLKNNFLLYILPTAVGPFYVIIIKTFIEQMAPALEESAQIDGAGYPTIFFKIVFPLSKPILATVAIFAAVNQWNMWYDNMFLCTNGKLNTLQLILYNYLREAEGSLEAMSRDVQNGNIDQIEVSPTSIRMTITMIVTLPIIFVYPFFQKYFITGVMIGAIKG